MGMPSCKLKTCKLRTWMSRWKLGSMVSKWVDYNLLINIYKWYWGEKKPLILTFDPKLPTGHPSIPMRDPFFLMQAQTSKACAETIGSPMGTILLTILFT